MVTPSRPLEAQCHHPPEQQLTHALACFQAEVSAISSPDLSAVAEAARPAFRQGIGWFAQLGEQHGRPRLQVTVRHAAGAELSSEAWADEPGDLADMTGLMLAMLLGIPVSAQARAAKLCSGVEQCVADKPEGPLVPADRPEPDGESEAPDQQTQAQSCSGGTPDGSGEPALLPLTPEEISGYHRRVLDLPQASRRELTNAFREHFQVPRSARSIGDRITQRQHGDFIERFLEEVQGQALENVPSPPAA
ncbi:hypothetical protein FQK07_14195 [Synechococcus sp. BSF8S]|uniref:hypothetical protein n=1 Tax=Synechococcales TaxID=1890424 RepID=UPI001624EE4B|nr:MULTISPECIES: hypothetical protein [unclassified Synechococcus]MBC1262381.1 hypothetical protein [Synechococcus sp. BSF8S]MBC1265284.1 hypothetical protein [Synechococcus sp. BSA11S]